MPNGNNANISNEIINKLITQELQSNTQICSTVITNKNEINQIASGNCTNVAVVNNKYMFQINTACFSNYKFMGKVTNDIANSILTTIQQKKTGMNLGGNSVNLQEGILNIINTYITQDNITELVNAFVTTNKTNQICSDNAHNYNNIHIQAIQ